MALGNTISTGLCTLAVLLTAPSTVAAETPIDLSAYQADCKVRVQGWNGHLRIAWPSSDGDNSEVTLDLSGQRPLIESMATRTGSSDAATIMTALDPIWFLTVGERRASDEKPPDQKWEVFFDNPHRRPHEIFTSKLAINSAK